MPYIDTYIYYAISLTHLVTMDLNRAFLHAQKTEDSMCFAATSSRVYFNYAICLTSNMRQYRAAKGAGSLSHRFIESLPPWVFVCFVFRGEFPGCRLFGTASMLEWLRNSSPTTHRTAVWKDGAEIPWGWSLPECLTSPFILTNSVETAAPFNGVSHPGCCEQRN